MMPDRGNATVVPVPGQPQHVRVNKRAHGQAQARLWSSYTHVCSTPNPSNHACTLNLGAPLAKHGMDGGVSHRLPQPSDDARQDEHAVALHRKGRQGCHNSWSKHAQSKHQLAAKAYTQPASRYLQKELLSHTTRMHERQGRWRRCSHNVCRACACSYVSDKEGGQCKATVCI